MTRPDPSPDQVDAAPVASGPGATASPGDGLAHPRQPRWTRRKDSRPSELLDAALDLFIERGFAAARLEDVAARAGVSKGTLYRYFTNKEELLKAAVRTSIVPLLTETRSAVEADQGPSDALLARLVDAWWLRFGATRLSGILKLVIAESGNFPEVARFFHEEVVEPNTRIVTLVLERGIARREFRPHDVLATAHSLMAPLVLKAIWANSIDHCCVASQLDPLDLIRHHLDLVLRALHADSRPPAPLSSPAPLLPRPPRSGIE